MRRGPSSITEDVVHLELDFASLELSVDEFSELVRLLRERSRLQGGGPAGAAADRLDLVRREVVSMATKRVPEAELDAMADGAWEWLRGAGSDPVPERVLLLLDVLRSRHAHE
jgi:hypothetical protein